MKESLRFIADDGLDGTGQSYTKINWACIETCEAAVLLWLGHKKQWPDFKWASLGVVFAMALPLYLTFVTLQWDMPAMFNDWPIVNVACLALLTYALTHFIMARYWQQKMKGASDMSPIISAVLLLSSLAVWFINGIREAQSFLASPHWLPAVVVFVSASWMLFVLLAHRLKWDDLHKIRYAITPVLAYLVIMMPNLQPYHASFGILAWLMVFAVNYWALNNTLLQAGQSHLIRPTEWLSIQHVVLPKVIKKSPSQLQHPVQRQ